MRIITRTVFVLSMVSLFADVASEMLYPVIPVYLKEIGFTVLWIGILEGVVNFTAGISKGYFGKLSDEKGLRLPFVKLGYFFSALSKPLIATFTYPVWIFFVRTLDRLGKGIRTASRDALLSQQATKETKARVFGFHRSMDTVGAAIGPVIALLFLYFYPGNYTTLFYLAFIPGIISILLIFLLKEKKQPVSTLGKGSFFSFFKYWKIATPEFRQVVPGFLLFALFNSSDIFLLLITKESIGENEISVLGTLFNADTITIAAYIVYNLVYAAISYPMGVLADRLSHKTVIVSGFILFAVVYGGFACHPSVSVIFLLFTLYGVYAAATEGVIKAWITNLAHHENTATAIGFYTSCESIGSLLASIIAGAAWTFISPAFTFSSTAVVAVIVALYLLRSGTKP
ncbi:MAG: MFS transporter [Chitinophagaceae bacterium]|nr:MFS transporter [Chitinophagaceae bacterium]